MEEKDKKEEFKYPIIDVKRTGSLLRLICKCKNLTVKDIQKKLHIASNQAIYDWFNGKTMPSLNNLYALSCLINIPMEGIIITKKQNDSYFVWNVCYVENNRPRIFEYFKRLQRSAS